MANEDGGDEWAAELVKRVGLMVKDARDGKSAAWLSDRTSKLGYRVSPTVIAKLDSGHRGGVLSVAELFILAAALDIPPLVLLFPGLPDGEVEIIPRRPATSWDAYMWAIGMAPSFLNPAERSDGYQLTRATRRRYELYGELGRLRVRLGLHNEEDDPSTRGFMEQRASNIKKEIGQLDSEIRELGGVLKDA